MRPYQDMCVYENVAQIYNDAYMDEFCLLQMQ